MTIKTVRKNVWLLSANDLSESRRADIIDSIEYDEDESAEFFFFYQGILYDVREFMRCESEGWDGVYSLNAFAAVYIRLSDDRDQIDVGFVAL